MNMSRLNNIRAGKVFVFAVCLMAEIGTSDCLFRIKRFHTDAVKTHNMARFLHGAIPLTLSIPLCDSANAAASNFLDEFQLGASFDQIKPRFAAINTSDTGSRLLSEWQGENMAKLDLSDMDDDADEWDGVGLGEKTVPLIAKVINDWYGEGKDFDCEKNPNKPFTDEEINQALPFTQIVWSSTFSVGCGYARDPDMVIIVCRYHPVAYYGRTHSIIAHVPRRIFPVDIAKPFFEVTFAHLPEISPPSLLDDWYDGVDGGSSTDSTSPPEAASER